MSVMAFGQPSLMVHIFALCINEVKKVTLFSHRLSVAKIALA